MVTGVGFLGAGVILCEQGRIAGLTTAATIWATASVGLAMAYGLYLLSVLTMWIIFGLLALNRLPGWQKVKGKPKPDPHPDARDREQDRSP